MRDYFKTYPGRLKVTGDATTKDQHIHSDIPQYPTGPLAIDKDPIFGADGGLVFNWYYSNNGARIAVPGAYKSPYNLPSTGDNSDDLHGLGNELGASTSGGGGGSEWWHDVAEKQGDCHGNNCKVVGSDHGTHLSDGNQCMVPGMRMQYAIYVSKELDSFPCTRSKLSGGVVDLKRDLSDQTSTVAPTSAPTPSPTHSPTASPTPSPTHSPTPSPTAPTPAPTAAPTVTPTPSPTATPTPSPTHAPTHAPTPSPTHAPTPSPTTPAPTAPTQAPTWHPDKSTEGDASKLASGDPRT